jgi:hypothetical protein
MPIGFLTDGDFAAFKELDAREPAGVSEYSNPFAYWLKAKAQYHRRNGHLGAEPLGGCLARVVGESG